MSLYVQCLAKECYQQAPVEYPTCWLHRSAPQLLEMVKEYRRHLLECQEHQKSIVKREWFLRVERLIAQAEAKP